MRAGLTVEPPFVDPADAPEWKKMHHRLGIDHPANQFHVHYNWICWVHEWGLDTRLVSSSSVQGMVAEGLCGAG
jgi:hypothetical protein